jgi:hypothetical protein
VINETWQIASLSSNPILSLESESVLNRSASELWVALVTIEARMKALKLLACSVSFPRSVLLFSKWPE